MQDLVDSGTPFQAPQNPGAETPSGTPPAAKPMGAQVLKGAAWITIQSILAQAAALLAKVVTFRYLSKSDIAVATWAASTTTFLVWLQPVVADVLVQRQRHFHRWANPAFWITLYSSLVLLIVGAAVGPLLVLVYHHDWRVAPLFLLACASLGVGTLFAVWTAEASIHFHFRWLAIVASAGALLAAGMTALMAWLRLGPWAIGVPAATANALMLLLYIRAGSFRPHRGARRRDLGILLRPGMALSAAAFFGSLVMFFDNVCVGIFQTPEDLAIYGLAFTLSYQLLQLLSRGLRGVMLPAFSALERHPERRTTAYLDSLRLTSWVCMPVMVLPIPSMRQLILAVFKPAYEQAIPLLQVFLLGVGFVMIQMIAYTFMQAAGEFRRCLIGSILHGVGFVIVVLFAAILGNVRTVTIVVSATYVLSAMIWGQAALPRARPAERVQIVLAAFAPYCFACAGAAVAYWAVSFLASPWMQTFIALPLGCLVYLACSWVFLKPTMVSTFTRAFHVFRRRRAAA